MLYQNRLKRLLAEGEIPMGMMMVSDSVMHAEVIAQTGVDYVVIETEHGTISPLAMEPLATLCRVLKSYDVTPLVRVPANDPILIQKSLDAGALGVVAPHIQNREDAERMVKATRFPPEGFRGCGPLVPANRFVGEFNSYVSNSNPEIMAVALIEDRHGLENFEEICGVDGVSMVSVGVLDLAFSMGIKDYQHPDVAAAREKIFSLCRDKGIPVSGIHADRLRAAVDSGMRVVANLGTEPQVLYEACKEKVDRVKAAVAEAKAAATR